MGLLFLVVRQFDLEVDRSALNLFFGMLSVILDAIRLALGDDVFFTESFE